MLNLIIAELRKLLRQRVLSVGFLLLAVLCVLLSVWQVAQVRAAQPWTRNEAELLYTQYAASPTEIEAYAAWLRQIGDLHTQPSVLLEDQPGLYTAGSAADDLALLEQLMTDAALPDTFARTMEGVIRNAQINYSECLYSGATSDSYACRFQLESERLYTRVRDEVSIPFGYRSGWETYYTFAIPGLLSMLIGIMIATSAFILERDVGMLPLVRVSRLGRGYTVAAKLIAVAVLGAGATVFLSLEAFVLIGGTLGYSDPSMPIQALPALRLSWLLLSVGELFPLHLALRVIGVVAVAFAVVFFSLLLPRYILTYAAGVLFFGVNYVCYLGQGLQKTNPIRYLNLLALADGIRAVGRFDAVPFGNLVVGYLWAALILALLVTVVSIVGVALVYCHGQGMLQVKLPLPTALRERLTVRLPRRKSRRYPLRERSMSLYCGEQYKLWSASRLAIMMVFLLAIDAGWYGVTIKRQAEDSYYDALYAEYVDAIEGDWSPEKEIMLTDFTAEQNAIRAGYASAKQDYHDGKLTMTEFLTYQRAYYQVPDRLLVIEELKVQADYLRTRYEERGEVGSFFYATGWRAMLDRPADLFLFAMLLILVPGIWTQEFGRQRFLMILFSTARGRSPVIRAKIGAVLSSAMVLALLSQVIHGLIVVQLYRLPLPDSALWSLENYSMLSADLPLWGAVMLHSFIRLAAALLLALLTMTTALLLTRPLPAMVVVAALTLLPGLLGRIGVEFLLPMDYLLLFGGLEPLTASFAAEADFAGITALLVGMGLISAVLCLLQFIWRGDRRNPRGGKSCS